MIPTQRALIIGGTHGLGRAIAHDLHGRFHCVVTGRSEPVDLGDTLDWVRIDLTNSMEVDALSQRIANERAYQLIVWTAATLKPIKGAFQTLPPAAVRDSLLVNLDSPLLLIHAAWHRMHMHGIGTLVVVSSSTGLVGKPKEAAYATAKFGQVGFAQSLGKEIEGSEALRVLLVTPGGMKTPLWEGMEVKGYDSFLEPAFVANQIVSRLGHQEKSFAHLNIPREGPTVFQDGGMVQL